MNELPAPEQLAKLVSNVTSTLLGITFHAVDAVTPTDGKWKTAVLPIPGKRPITVGLASDTESCSHLSAAMFSCRKEDVDASMMDDSLRELANMTAGLVKNALKLDQSLGLPRITADAGGAMRQGPPGSNSVMVKADHLGILLWVAEGNQQ